MREAPGEAPLVYWLNGKGVGDGTAAQLAPTIRPHRSNANQHLVIIHYSLV
jgi:hypothetical protein